MSDSEDSDISGMENEEILSGSNAKQHAQQLKLLQEKDPEFYQYLKETEKELLDFKDEGEDTDVDVGTDLEEDVESDLLAEGKNKSHVKPITTSMVDSWCRDVKSRGSLKAVRSLLRAFRAACHYGDDDGDADQSSEKLGIISSSVFNKVMVFVLNEMDGILRTLLKAPEAGGKKETIMELTTTKQWKTYGGLMRVYLGNAYHILNQMTDEQMISFTIKRVKASAAFLAAFPSLLRKYIKVIIHTWGSGRGPLTVVSFLFLRDLCVRLGSDCLETCLRGVYKAYVMNCKLSKSVSISKLQQIQFLGNCVTEICGVDPPAVYRLAFLFIRQLATLLRGVLSEKGLKVVNEKKKGKKYKESKSTKKQMEKAYQKVYEWQYIFCLELWTSVICTYGSDTDFRPLAYPLSQIIQGVAGLVPTVRYFPLRLRCIRMLNRIASATGTFIPVSSLLLDTLEMKELRSPPTGGVGKAVNLLSIKQVDKNTVKTRSFQEACIHAVIEELAEHLSHWSRSVSFFELSFIPLVRLRSFCKIIKAERFRKEIKDLIRQVEANYDFTNSKRVGIGFSPNDPAVEEFLRAEKENGESHLSEFVKSLRERTQLMHNSLVEKSVIVGAESSVSGKKVSEYDEENEEEGEAAFSSSWLPEKKKSQVLEKKKKNKKRTIEEREDDVEPEEEDDIVEDLVLSSDEEDEVDGEEELLSDEGGDSKSQTASKDGASAKKQNNSSRKKRKPKPRRKKKAKVSV
ncbi:Nucleolar complex protein 2 [Rhynchospora pubera]|uniref:Nucleolar complex protein 2 n=1 Tax=Rhynchospora pubera TaxID=906938 RepID=A0AAV8GID0_9POAL|nr:Nucleolar complex protein 2 [Rhynchospora pubera]